MFLWDESRLMLLGGYKKLVIAFFMQDDSS
jgi:hypothetical protein